ncbi:inverse autotransporter beta domain-containing protein [unidentified bacterial endosymbiont]|uniref:inverse autotransporter beta domain-containing protein n=1 Tax=unidentified bacterial endosymbiont TaxID=2355 RepID=UPI00209EF2ED|nr:inverse autotransporter beta domain-containing protein [unidentified bacterial endosymbiont]
MPTLGSTSTSAQTAPSTDKTISKTATSLARMNGSVGNYAYEQMSQLASGTIENWLKQYGNARITLNSQTDNSKALANSSADILFGLHNQENRLDYIQFDTHYQDTDDMIVNVGLGQRYFLKNKSMLGYNVFYDQNMSSNVTRAGVGVELWRDYFKFAGNAYFALSDWKDSDEMQDYDEKAADGYDLQVEGYLPSYAQLGGHVKYEQYFGDDVALFGTDDLQTDPKAITVGLSYTPVPLVTFAVDYKKGSDSLDDTAVSLAFNYAFGVPWSEQVSPDAVQARRSLMGSRFDFVDRNNDIVMQYRKQDVIKLSLPASLSGQASQDVTLAASVEAKNGLDHIQWDPSSSLLKAGGVVTPGSDKTHFKVTLPPVAGQYTLKGTAYDRHNNASNTAQTQFSVTGGEDPGNKQITFATPATAWVDRQEPISVSVKNADGNPATGASVTFSTNCSDCSFSESDVETKLVNGNAVATTLYSTTETTRGTVTEITACITGTTTCSQQRVEFNAIPKLSGQLQLEGKALLQNSLPASWISNTQFELGETATGGDGNYIWKSSDDNVATVDDHGSVTIKDQLADFTITITTLGRTSDDANSLHVKKGNEMLHVTSDLETYADAKNNCASAGRKMPEIADFQRITALWGHMASYPTYAAMPQYVWANSEEAADVGSAYRMKDGKVQNNIVKTDPNYQGCLE